MFVTTSVSINRCSVGVKSVKALLGGIVDETAPLSAASRAGRIHHT